MTTSPSLFNSTTTAGGYGGHHGSWGTSSSCASSSAALLSQFTAGMGVAGNNKQRSAFAPVIPGLPATPPLTPIAPMGGSSVASSMNPNGAAVAVAPWQQLLS